MTLPSQRVLLNGEATITETLLDGTGATPVAPADSATVTVTNSAGDTLASGAAASPTLNPSEFTFPVTNQMTSQLDWLTLEWSTSNGVWVSTVEVVGGFLFSVNALRTFAPQFADTAKYSTAEILRVRNAVEDAIETELGYALVPRFISETFQAWGTQPLRLRPYVRALRSVDSAVSSVALADLGWGTTGYLSGGRWYGRTTVRYEHGLDGPSARHTRAGLSLAKNWLTASPVDDRASTFTSVDGGTYSLLTAGRGGSIFGVREVDQMIMAERLVAVA